MTSPRNAVLSASTPSSVPGTHYIFFGGKGGVGKTTAAVATAVHLLDRASPGDRILLFSTDPAHSLADSLATPVGDSPRVVLKRGGADLSAWEMDAGAAIERFKSRHSAVLHKIAERGTILDSADVDELLGLSLPGMDEVMALVELSELDRQERYTRVVVDTAPSGHTTRMLRLPQLFATWIGALDRMSDKHRFMVAQLGRRSRPAPDEVDVFLDDLRAGIDRLRDMLYNPEHSSFILVTIPESMAVEETVRYAGFLHEQKVPLAGLIVNRVEQRRAGCSYCRARYEAQRADLADIDRRFRGIPRPRAPLFPTEVRGGEAVARFGLAVWTGETAGKGLAPDGGKVAGRVDPARSREPFPLTLRRLLMFGGKGGVGKTTAAAAVGLALARAHPDSRFLVFSIDPAHSLSDSLDEEVGPLKRGVAGVPNLDAMEIDPGVRFEELKQRYRQWIDQLFDNLTGDAGWDIRFDREAMRELISLSPPGIDEIAALSVIADLIEDDSYDCIVLDTAPTGHLIRFLELPDVALSWVRTFLRLLLKYRVSVKTTGMGEELVSLSKSIKKVHALLTDPEFCEFVAVGIPEQMSVSETGRLIASLHRLKAPIRALLINNVVPAAAARTCLFCRARRRSQQKAVALYRRDFEPKGNLFIAPQQPRQIRGPRRLGQHYRAWNRIGAAEFP